VFAEGLSIDTLPHSLGDLRESQIAFLRCPVYTKSARWFALLKAETLLSHCSLMSFSTHLGHHPRVARITTSDFVSKVEKLHGLAD